MKSDLSLMIDDIRLNIRAGIIFRYNNKTLIEVLKTREGNSVIPGGRVKIDELCVDSLKREIKEELHYELVDEKISFIKNLEYFYEYNGEKVHELFFVYKYSMDEEDYLNHNLAKIEEYRKNGIFIGKNLILTFESASCPLNIGEIRKSMKEIFCR